MCMVTWSAICWRDQLGIAVPLLCYQRTFPRFGLGLGTGTLLAVAAGAHATPDGEGNF